MLSRPRRPAPAELMASFLAAGVEARPHPGVPERAIVIPHGSRVDRLPGFADGMFSIQDPATLEAVRLLDAVGNLDVTALHERLDYEVRQA